MDEQTTQHHSAVVGGSNAARTIACTGSHALIAQAPPEEGSVYAQEGTALHKCMELLINGGTPMARLQGAVIKGVLITDEHVKEKLEPALEAYLAAVDDDDWSALELRVSLTPIPGAFGTVDVAFKRAWPVGEPKQLHIWDWKFGSQQVSATDNAQLLFYAAAMMTDPKTKVLFDGVRDVYLHICQPNDWGQETVRAHKVRILDLAEFVLALKRAVEIGKTDQASLTTGSHCRFCPAAPICPELEKRAREAVILDPNDMDPKDVAGLLTMIETLEPWITKVRSYAHDVMEKRAMKVPGYKLVPKRAQRKWVDNLATIIARMKDEKLDTSKAFEQPKLRSPAQFEKEYGKTKVTKLKDLIVQQSSGTVIAHEDDKRKAIIPGATFRNLADQIRALNHRK